MDAHKNPSPALPQPERAGFVNLRFRIRLRRSPPRDHADGSGERGAVGGRRQEAAALSRRGSPPRRGGGYDGRRPEGAGGAGRRGDRELSWHSLPPPRRGGGDGRRLEGGGGAGRGGDGALWSGFPPPRQGGEDGGRRRDGAERASRGGDVGLWLGSAPPRRGWGDDGRRREGTGRVGDGELSSGSPPPPRQGGGDGRRGDGGGAGSAERGGGVVNTCHVCSKTFDRVKALHGHMRSCRAAADELPPSAPRQERANKRMVEKKKADDEGLLARALERSWAVTGRRRRGRIPSHGWGESLVPPAKRACVATQDRAPVATILREVTGRRPRCWIPSHGGGESLEPPAKRACVAAQDRTPVAAMLHEVTGLQVVEDDLDQPWAAEMVLAAQELVLLSAGEADFGPIADGHSEQSVVTVDVPPAKIPKVKVPVLPSTIRNSPVVTGTDVIAIIDDDGEDEDVEPNSAVAEISACAMTIAISAPDTAETVTIAPAADAATTVTITAAPATPSAVAIATAPATAAMVVTIAAAPDAAKDKEIAFCSNGNGGVAAIARAGEITVYRCPKCSKTFRSYQALGGHMANHKISEKRAKELQDGRARHVCAKCSRTFPTGQALGGHMRLHYAGQLLGAGKTTVWAAPSTASGLSIPGPAAAGSSSFVFTLLKQEEPPEEMAMVGNIVPVYVPAATAFGLSLPAATSSSFPLMFDTPKQEEKTPEVMARAPRNGTGGGFRLFGVDIAEGPKEEPME